MFADPMERPHCATNNLEINRKARPVTVAMHKSRTYVNRYICFSRDRLGFHAWCKISGSVAHSEKACVLKLQQFQLISLHRFYTVRPISTTRMINALHLFMTLSLKQLHLHPLPDRMDRWGGGGAGEYVFFLPKVHPSIWQSC